jgi:hypothetical protein
MTPHSLGTVSIQTSKTPAQKAAERGWAGRHGTFPKGTVLPETQVPACPRVKVADLPEDFLPKKYLEVLEQNQLIASCCRHPENHEIEARKSHPDEPAPDIYIFHCNECKRQHRRFCVGLTDVRPVWDAG